MRKPCGCKGKEDSLVFFLLLITFPRGDHTFADSYLTVIPRGTEFVVFSIDGSFAASVSIMGSDPKVRAGAVDVVRYCSSPFFSGFKQDFLWDWSTLACSDVIYVFVLFSCSSSLQALAGFRLFDHLCDRATRHAEAAGSGLVVSAQLPSWHCFLLWWPGPRPTQTQGQLPQVYREI